MKPEVKKMWLDALRSGKYKQGKGALKIKTEKGFRHCCLGVLCELYQDNHKKKLKEGEPHELDDISGVVDFSGNETFLPPEVSRWAGLNKIDPTIPVKTAAWDPSLSELNDAGRKFTTIAKLIEKHL
jgi:hypothetical protein